MINTFQEIRFVNLLCSLTATAIMTLGALSCTSVNMEGHKIGPFAQPYLAKKPSKSVPVTMAIFKTSHSNAGEFNAVQGGGFFTRRKVIYSGFLIRHPKGDLLFDTGLGKDVDKQTEVGFSWIDKILLAYEKNTPIVVQLKKQNIELKNLKLVASHLHWDHVSGAKDFPNAELWTTKPEYDYASKIKGKVIGFIQEQYLGGGIKWNFMKLEPKPYENFSESFDMYGDGSVVFVNLPGHTEGALGMFVTVTSGKRYFIIGDTTWLSEGFEWPAFKPYLVHSIIEKDHMKLNESILKVHDLYKRYSDLTILPSHDGKALKKLGYFPLIIQ